MVSGSDLDGETPDVKLGTLRRAWGLFAHWRDVNCGRVVVAVLECVFKDPHDDIALPACSVCNVA